MYKSIIISVISIFVLNGCAAIPVYKLNTIEQTNDIYLGIETVKKIDRDTEILLQFERQSQKYYEFYLSIKNTSGSSTIFNPKYIYSQSAQGDSEPFNRKYLWSIQNSILIK